MRTRTLALLAAVTGIAMLLNSCAAANNLSRAVGRSLNSVTRAATAPLRAIN